MWWLTQLSCRAHPLAHASWHRPLQLVRACMYSMQHAACCLLCGVCCMLSVACCPLQWRVLHAVQVRARSVDCADRARVVAASRGERQCVLRGGAHADVAVALARVPPQPRPSRRIEPQRTAPARPACSAQRAARQPYHAARDRLSVPCACSRTAYVTGDDHEPRPVTLLCFYTFGEPRSGIPRGTARAVLRSP